MNPIKPTINVNLRVFIRYGFLATTKPPAQMFNIHMSLITVGNFSYSLPSIIDLVIVLHQILLLPMIYVFRFLSSIISAVVLSTIAVSPLQEHDLVISA